jgi:hypothetical protein
VVMEQMEAVQIVACDECLSFRAGKDNLYVTV